jgi:hypothetical protein
MLLAQHMVHGCSAMGCGSQHWRSLLPLLLLAAASQVHHSTLLSTSAPQHLNKTEHNRNKSNTPRPAAPTRSIRAKQRVHACMGTCCCLCSPMAHVCHVSHWHSWLCQWLVWHHASQSMVSTVNVDGLVHTPGQKLFQQVQRTPQTPCCARQEDHHHPALALCTDSYMPTWWLYTCVTPTKQAASQDWWGSTGRLAGHLVDGIIRRGTTAVWQGGVGAGHTLVD